MGGAVDSPFQVADRPRGQARRFGQLLLRQPGLGPQLPQQPSEPRQGCSATAPAPANAPVVTGPPPPSPPPTATQNRSPQPARQSGSPGRHVRPPAPWRPSGPVRFCGLSRGPMRVANTAAAANSGISRGGLPPPRPSPAGGRHEPHPAPPPNWPAGPAHLAGLSRRQASPKARNPTWPARQAARPSPHSSPSTRQRARAWRRPQQARYPPPRTPPPGGVLGRPQQRSDGVPPLGACLLPEPGPAPLSRHTVR